MIKIKEEQLKNIIDYLAIIKNTRWNKDLDYSINKILNEIEKFYSKQKIQKIMDMWGKE